jgi:hypothetical protein
VAAVTSFLAAVLTEIYLCNVCSCQEILRRNGRGQAAAEKASRRQDAADAAQLVLGVSGQRHVMMRSVPSAPPFCPLRMGQMTSSL